MILADAEATRQVGWMLGAIMVGGQAIALVGDLGAGKTTLVTGIVKAMGAGDAASPTFSLVNEYTGGRLIVWHVDLYRLEREQELVELGLEEMLGDPRGICVIEWADKFPVMPPDHVRVELGHVSEGRSIEITGTGHRSRELAALVLKALG